MVQLFIWSVNAMIDGRWEMGDGRWEMGDGRWEMEVAIGTFRVLGARIRGS